MRGDRDGDGSAGIDFVVGDEAGPGPDAGFDPGLDDELPSAPDRPGARRAWAAGALAILGVVVVVRAAGSSDDPAPVAASQHAAPSTSRSASLSAAPAPGVAVVPVTDVPGPGATGGAPALGDETSDPMGTVVTVASPTGDVPVVAFPAAPVRFDPHRGVLNCPVGYGCSVDYTVPAPVAAAVNRSFADAQIRQVVTVYGRRAAGGSRVLLQRTVVAGAGRTFVNVEVRARMLTDTAAGRVLLGGDYVASSYRVVLPLYTVIVEAREPKPAGGIPVGTQLLALLAGDAGLLAS